MQNDVMSFIKDFEATNKIKPEYDLSGENIRTIIDESIHSGDVSELIGLVRNFFVFGYAQGYFSLYMSKDEQWAKFFESKELSDIDQLTGYTA